MINKHTFKVYDRQNEIDTVTHFSKKWYEVKYCNTTGIGTITLKGNNKPICMVQPVGMENPGIDIFNKVD